MSIVNAGYSLDLRRTTGGGGGTVDATARTQISALENQVNGADGTSIPLGALTTVDGKVYTPVGGAQTVPTPASNIATDPNFTEISGAASDKTTISRIVTGASTVTNADFSGNGNYYGVSGSPGNGVTHAITVAAGAPDGTELLMANTGLGSMQFVPQGGETVAGNLDTVNTQGFGHWKVQTGVWSLVDYASAGVSASAGANYYEQEDDPGSVAGGSNALGGGDRWFRPSDSNYFVYSAASTSWIDVNL